MPAQGRNVAVFLIARTSGNCSGEEDGLLGWRRSAALALRGKVDCGRIGDAPIAGEADCA
jgi:hypothetical protein